MINSEIKSTRWSGRGLIKFPTSSPGPFVWHHSQFFWFFCYSFIRCSKFGLTNLPLHTVIAVLLLYHRLTNFTLLQSRFEELISRWEDGERFREIRLKCCARKIAKSHDEIQSRILTHPTSDLQQQKWLTQFPKISDENSNAGQRIDRFVKYKILSFTLKGAQLNMFYWGLLRYLMPKI